jgi:phage RecT family recombinase
VNTAVVVREAKADLVANIERMRPQIEASLPPGVDPARFTRVVMNALQNMPELLDQQVDRQSVYNACLRGAQLGLMPDKREGAIVIVNEKRKDGAGRDVWVKTAQFRDMIGGLRKLASEFGFDLIARSVYENDAFDYECGDVESISHKPPRLGQERGALIGAYAIATRLRDNQKYRLVYDMAQINKRRDVAQTKAVWDKWTSEMGEKTVARALFKVLPLTDDNDDAALERFNRLVTKEDEVEAAGAQASAAQLSGPAAPTTTGPRRPRGLETVAAAAQSETVDTGTGEVIQGEVMPAGDPQADNKEEEGYGPGGF